MKHLLIIAALVAVTHTLQQQTVFQSNQGVKVERLLALDDDRAVWADPEQLQQRNIKFIDITDTQDVPGRADWTRANHRDLPVPKRARFESLVRPMLQLADVERMRQRLTRFTQFKNRYYKSQTGLQSAEWLLATINAIVAESGAAVTVTKFQHAWSQFSIVARFDRFESATEADMNADLIDDDDEPMVIVGAHQDTVKGGFFREGRAPGADDDGSGTVTTLEAFTILCQNKNFKPVRPVEFHWYSAEEMGLLGSQDISSAYQRAEKRVVGMMHFDMTGYGKKGVYGIITDYTDPDLTNFLRTLALTYGGLKPVDSQCKYGCSDHASWTRSGYRAAFPFEGEFSDSSPYIHTKEDTVANIDFNHMAEFVKLAVSFAVEMSHQ